MASQYVVYPPAASTSWKPPVDTQADLPLAGNSLGDARVTQDTSDIYVWTGSMWQQAGGGSGPTAVGDIQIWLSTRGGVGSGNGSVGYYDSVFKDTGTAGGQWTYVSDTTNGDSITIGKAGLYTVDVVETGGSDLQYMIWGITLNSSNLGASPKDLPVGQALSMSFSAFSGIEFTPYNASSTQYLNIGDVLRWQCGNYNATDAATTASLTMFKVTYIGDY